MRHLELVEAHVSKADRRLVRQRKLVARLERDGGDAAEARAHLTELEESRNVYIADRDRLLRELGGKLTC